MANGYRVKIRLCLYEIDKPGHKYDLWRYKYLPGEVLRPLEDGTYFDLVLDKKGEAINHVFYDLDEEVFVVDLEAHISSDLDGLLGTFMNSDWRREMPKAS